MVLLAAQSDSPAAAAALQKLCRAYWQPLYFFVRRRGYSAPEAEDLTQEFFRRLLETRGLRKADPARGKFRSFLLGAMKNFLANEWDRARAQKRGGGAPLLSLDAEAAEELYGLEAVDQLTADKIYERRWAQALLDRSLSRLRGEAVTSMPAGRWEAFEPFLTDEPDAPSYADTAARLALTPQAVKSAIHRLRGRFRDICREEIAQTVADPTEVDEEIRQLLVALQY